MTTHNEAFKLFNTWAGNRWPTMTADQWPTNSPVWQATSAAMRYLDAGCAPLLSTDNPHPEALARAFQEMETAGQLAGQSVDWTMRIYAIDGALKLSANWLAGLIMCPNARQVIMPWDKGAAISGLPSTISITNAEKQGYQKAVAEMLTKLETMK